MSGNGDAELDERMEFNGTAHGNSRHSEEV
jgi:hypothetical protein